MTAEEVIRKAMQQLNMASAAEPLNDDDLVFGLSSLNTYIDDLANDRLMIFHTKRSVYDLVADQASYTIGDGADWDGFRPIEILRAGFLNTAVTPDEPLETPVKIFSDQQWADIGLKTLQNTICWGLWYDTGVRNVAEDNAAAWGTIYPYPVPSQANQMVLYVPTPLDEVPETEDGLATDLIIPRGYRRMFITNLALEIADAFEITPTPLLVSRAQNSKRNIRKSNSKPITLEIPSGLTSRGRGRIRGYNILTNE